MGPIQKCCSSFFFYFTWVFWHTNILLNSNFSGYSTASKHALAMKDAEMGKKDALRVAKLVKKDAEMNKINKPNDKVASDWCDC